jgi:pyruvate-formate lyase-activating enzyme
MTKEQAKQFLKENNMTIVELARRVKKNAPHLKAKVSSIRCMISDMINKREFYAGIAVEVARLYPELDFKPFESRYNKKYKKENKERAQERAKEYYQRNKEVIKKRVKNHSKRNKEKIQAYKRAN